TGAQRRTPLTPLRLQENLLRVIANVPVDHNPVTQTSAATQRNHPLAATHHPSLPPQHQLGATLTNNRWTTLRTDRAIRIERRVHVVRVSLRRIRRVPVPGVRAPPLTVPGNRPSPPMPDQIPDAETLRVRLHVLGRRVTLTLRLDHEVKRPRLGRIVTRVRADVGEPELRTHIGRRQPRELP